MIEDKFREYLNKKEYNIPLQQLFCTDCKIKHGSADRIYPFSNENIRGYIGDMDLKGKKVLTVGSSGEQVLNAVFNGATDVTLFDANIFARYYVELKIAAIKNLSLDAFLKYFTSENILDWKYYSKISHDLSPEAQLFWDNIMLLENGIYTNINIRLFYNLFHDSGFENYKYANSYYRNLTEFEKLKSLIPNVKIDYVLEEFKNFPNALKGKKFDYVLLSNIGDYVSEDSFNKRVKYLYTNNLNKGGAIQVNYNFSNGRIKIKNFRELLRQCPKSKFRRLLVKSAGDFTVGVLRPSYASSEFIEKK